MSTLKPGWGNIGAAACDLIVSILLSLFIAASYNFHIGTHGFHDWVLPPFHEFKCPCLIEMRCSKCLKTKFSPGDRMDEPPERIYKFSGEVFCG